MPTSPRSTPPTNAAEAPASDVRHIRIAAGLATPVVLPAAITAVFVMRVSRAQLAAKSSAAIGGPLFVPARS